MASSEKLTEKVSFRLTVKESEELDKISRKLGCRPSDAMRMGLSAVTFAAGQLEPA